MIRSVGFAAYALIGLTLAACQSDIGSAPATPSSTTKTSATGSGMLTTRTAPAAVEGREFATLYNFDPQGKHGARVGLLAIRRDGSAVIVNSPPGVDVETIAQSQVGVQTGQHRKWFPIQSGSRPREASDAATYGQTIVWVETTQAMRASPDLKVFAVRSGQERPTLLSKSLDLSKSDVIPMSPGGNFITTDGVHVWWVRTYPTKDPSGWGSQILVRDIAGRGPLAVAIERAKNPVAAKAGLVYLRSPDVDPKMPANRYELRLHQGTTDTMLVAGDLVEGEPSSTICASETFIAWAVNSAGTSSENMQAPADGRLHVLSLASKVQQVIELGDNAGGLSLACGNTFVAWGNGSGNGDPGQYVFDIPSSKIWKLGELRGYSAVQAAGSILAWALPPKSTQDAVSWRVTKWQGR